MRRLPTALGPAQNLQKAGSGWLVPSNVIDWQRTSDGKKRSPRRFMEAVVLTVKTALSSRASTAPLPSVSIMSKHSFRCWRSLRFR